MFNSVLIAISSFIIGGFVAICLVCRQESIVTVHKRKASKLYVDYKDKIYYLIEEE